MDEIQKDSDNPNRSIACVSMDYFYRDLGTSESELARKGNFNFDHPGNLKHSCAWAPGWAQDPSSCPSDWSSSGFLL